MHIVTRDARSLAALALLALLASAAACAPPGQSPRPGGPPSAALVEVTNTSWFDVVMYTAAPGTRWRLGMVRSMATETFRVPLHAVVGGSGLRLVADPIGSDAAFVTDRINVSPGQLVELTVAPQLSMSHFAVRW